MENPFAIVKKDWQERLVHYVYLTRLHKPIGILLLLWPTLWALWLAASGMPDVSVLFVFIMGVILTRSAGCIINDIADRKVDGYVTRTKNRPLTSGKITIKNALILFCVLMLCAFALVLLMNPLTIALSFLALGLTVIYPFLKRVTHLPQLGLGAAFSFSIPMAYAAQTGEIPDSAWLLFFSNLLWTIAYDTQYAMTDREDDLKAGIKSTAILFDELDNVALLTLQGLFLSGMIMLGIKLSFGFIYYLSLLGASSLFTFQYQLTKTRQPKQCFEAFLNNHLVGAVIFVGIFIQHI